MRMGDRGKGIARRALIWLLIALILCPASSGLGEEEEPKEYTVISTGQVDALDGGRFALITWVRGTSVGACLLQDEHQVSGRLAAAQVNQEETNPNVLFCDGEITVWTFKKTGEGLYTVRAENGGYLNLESSSATVSQTPQQLTITTDASHPGQIHISDGDKRALNLKSGSIGKGFQAWRSYDRYEWFDVFELEKPLEPWKNQAQKVSARDVRAGDTVVIYYNEWNKEDQTFNVFAVNNAGGLTSVYDLDDEVRWMGTDTLIWQVEAQGDGFAFRNVNTGRYLSPYAVGFLSDAPAEIKLFDGQANGYSARIREWNERDGRWWSLQVSKDGLTTDEEGGAFFFGRLSSSGLPTEIEAMNSDELGIRISLYDFSSQETLARAVGNDPYIADQVRHVVSNTLTDSGYPISLEYNEEMDRLFNGGYVGRASHLFLKSVYDATGFLTYDCQTTFAQYNDRERRFYLYRGLGVPVSDGRVSAMHGNFFPYNTLNWSKLSPYTNQYRFGKQLTSKHPAYEDPLYMFNEKVNYYFGLSLEGTFVQGQNGLDAYGIPQICEWWCDDDVWLYVDDVLVLDIGGIHSALGGRVDFSTGRITVNGERTDLRTVFEDAGMSTADFDGYTFREGTVHTMKVFYLERGAGAGHLSIRMNLDFEASVK